MSEVVGWFGRRRRLWRLLGRRLLWTVPTAFGLAVVTFAVVNLVPGRPGEGLHRSAVSDEAAENLRRTYGFDLPLFLNTDIQDRGRRVRRWLAALETPARRALALRHLRQAGTLALPELVKAAGDTRDMSRRRTLEGLLASLLERLGEPGREQLSARGGAGYEGWWKGRLEAFEAGAIRDQVERLAGGQTGAAQAVRRLGQRAVPILIERLLAERSTGSARKRLSVALGAITGHQVIYDPDAPAGERRSALGQWRDFWRAEAVTYRDLGRGERFWGAFTQTRFARWVGRLLQGDFGESLYYRRRAWDIIAERLPVTLGLNLAALLLAWLVAVPLGVWAASRRGRRSERALGVGLLVLYSLPPFWVALMLLLFLGGIEGPALFPTAGLHSLNPSDYPAGSALLDLIWHAVLPVFCLSYAALAVLTRYARAGMLDVLSQDYIRTARAKGLSEGRVLWRHGLRNGVIPLINLAGMQLPYVLSGSVIVETIFDLPGLGSLTLVAIQQRDTNLLMGLLSLTAVLTLLGLLLADLAMLWADPRLTIDREGER